MSLKAYFRSRLSALGNNMIIITVWKYTQKKTYYPEKHYAELYQQESTVYSFLYILFLTFLMSGISTNKLQ